MKEIQWGIIHGEGDIVCNCDMCGEEIEFPFEDGCFDFKEVQNELKVKYKWISRKIDNEWYDFCCDKCYKLFLKSKGKENK